MEGDSVFSWDFEIFAILFLKWDFYNVIEYVLVPLRNRYFESLHKLYDEGFHNFVCYSWY